MSRKIIIVIVLICSVYIVLAQTTFFTILADSALTLTNQTVQYDPTYYKINFPNGDVPANKGVCTDVIIRAYRKLAIDLQYEVNVDMKTYFDKYPKIWGLKKPDHNIDHRRVQNLMTFFGRHGTVLKITQNPDDYKPGHIVCWSLGVGITHIGIVSNKKTTGVNRPLIIHNIGAGQVIDDCLFSYQIIGHYRYKK